MNQATKSTNAETHIEYLDILRILSMFSVVFLHVAAGSLRVNFDSLTWHVANFMTSLMSTSVPIFFMISGALLLSSSRTISVRYTYEKRIPKAFVPFLIWSLVAVFYYVLITKQFGGYFDRAAGEYKLMHILIQPTTIHLWFMYALIPMYMISPILKKLVDQMSSELIKYTMLLWLVFGSVLPTLIAFLPSNYHSFLNINYTFSLNFMSGFLGYFIAGYFLFSTKRTFSKKLLISIIAAVLLIITIGTWFQTARLNAYSEDFKTYQRIFTLILSVCMFLLAKEIFSKKKLSGTTSTILKFLSPLSFGIYLVHNLFVDYFSRKITLGPADSVFTLLKWYCIISILSLILPFILASIKYTSFLFTGINFKAACNCCNIQFLISSMRSKKLPE